MTKFRLFSDIHYGYNKTYAEKYTSETLSQLNDGFDGINLVAGDVGSTPDEVKSFCDKFIPGQRSIIIGGNHFMYGMNDSFQNINKEYESAIGDYMSEKTPAIFVDRKAVTCYESFDNVSRNAPVVFAATLWSNFMLNGIDRQEKAMRDAEYGVSDFRCSYSPLGSSYDAVVLSAYDMWTEFEHTLGDIKMAYIRAKQHNQPFILMTHFSVTPDATEEKYKDSPLQPYFCNDLRKWIVENIPETKFILQGHLHNRWTGEITDEEKNVHIPVYQNPFGYVTQNETYAEPEWDPKLIIEV